MEEPLLDAELEARLAADVAAGKTVCLSAAELQSPRVREVLPRLLDELTSRNRDAPANELRVPGYTVLGEIGQGGMSTVYLARHEALGRYVALKVAPKWLGHERAQERLTEEARAMARVSHPNIVTIHDILEAGDTIVIAMEWVDGLTLAGILRALPPKAHDDDLALVRNALGAPAVGESKLAGTAVHCFVRMVHDVARAVQRVHESGLLHLDIKPSNVLVRRDGTPLLADFGVVREMDLVHTRTRTFAGTPIYSAPEQLRRDDRQFGPHTDVYGLGVTLYELLARAQPLQHRGLTRLAHDLESGRVPHLSTRVEISPDLATVVHKAMAPELHLRYPTAAAFADDLLAFLEHRPVKARPLSRTQRLRRWVTHEPWKAALAGVLIVLVPVLLALGTQLLLDRPHMERLRLARLREQAQHLQQAAYQHYFLAYDTDAATARLRDAMELDRSDRSLACIAALVHEENSAAAARLFDLHPLATSAPKGLVFAARKARDDRAFFAEDELRELEDSSDPVDKYALALDRLMFAEDRLHEGAWRDAVARLADACMIGEPDPLLFGLHAYAAAQAGDRATLRSLHQVMDARWPDDLDVMTWEHMSLEVLDTAAADEAARRITAVHPQSPRGHELLVGVAYRYGFDERVGPLAAAARAEGKGSALIDRLLALSAARTSVEAARAALTDPRIAGASARERVRLLARADREGCVARFEERVADPATGRAELAAIVQWACSAMERGLAERAFARWQKENPDRHLLHGNMIHLLYQMAAYDRAAELARGWRAPLHEIDGFALRFCRLFATKRWWSECAELAATWQQHAAEPHRAEAAAHRGIALSRLGNFEGAAPLLDYALATRIEKQWHRAILLESAWVHVAPQAPPAVVDPQLAELRFAAYEARLGAALGPWALAVKAEIQFRSGDAAAAIDTATRAKNTRPVEKAAPEDLRSILDAALQRYR